MGHLTEAELYRSISAFGGTSPMTQNFAGTDSCPFTEPTDEEIQTNLSMHLMLPVPDAPFANDGRSVSQTRLVTLSSIDAKDWDGDDITLSVLSDVSDGTLSIRWTWWQLTPLITMMCTPILYICGE